jgi:hypothetical protein
MGCRFAREIDDVRDRLGGALVVTGRPPQPEEKADVPRDAISHVAEAGEIGNGEQRNNYGKISITVLIAGRTLWKVVLLGTVVTTWNCKQLPYNVP